MLFDYTDLIICAETTGELYAARLFSEEIKLRTGVSPQILPHGKNFFFAFSIDTTLADKDVFEIAEKDGGISITAKTVRGLIFGYSLFLRKTLYKHGKIILTESIAGTHIPQKKIRGHQVGYRAKPNTYDAWDYKQYFRYYLDMMAFGSNVCEHNGSKIKDDEINPLMMYRQDEFLTEASRLADELDLDVSLWQANADDESESEALSSRDILYRAMPRLDTVFVPGGDPGEMPAADFSQRCKKIYHILKKSHPSAQLHPSAQQPDRHWGDIFIKELESEPEEFGAVIMGPNHAFPIYTMREKVPSKYPLRFYPDITHNLRCEYPVNFQADDWHFALCNTLSRESVNPRPTEMRTLHRLFAPYTIGSVSYSEGVHDDVNKAIWSALEWDGDADLKEILLDYARFFFYGADENKIADTLLLLERNWQGDPAENPCIDFSYKNLCDLQAEFPFLCENWRFLLLLFRAACDKLVKMRRIFENSLCKKAICQLTQHRINEALDTLKTPVEKDYTTLRESLDVLAQKLFNLIGIQLDIEHYFADGWERGATLETIDNNVTDRAFLQNKLEYALTLQGAERYKFIDRLITRNKPSDGEMYYSVALHGVNTLGTAQEGEVYIDVQGDRPYTKKTPIAMSMAKVFDNVSFKAKFGAFESGTDYTLTVVYKSDKNADKRTYSVKANGKTVYRGLGVGGTKNEEFDKELLAPGFESATYILKSDVFVNGALDLEISELTDGVKLCELWIKKQNT